MAKVLPEGGRLTTIEKYDEFARIAAENIRNNGLSERIDIICGDAFDELPKLDPNQLFDFVFLDGNKERYLEYFKLLDPRLRPGGLMIVDDVLFQGDVLNDEPKTEKGIGVKRFLQAVESADQYTKILLPISNGLMLMYKCG
jgi:caffeoyl-CoA O-methyltransferase/O-methyltransferase